MSRGAEGKREKKREREIAAKPLNLIGGPDDETTAGHFAGRMKFFQRKWRAEKEREEGSSSARGYIRAVPRAEEVTERRIDNRRGQVKSQSNGKRN